MTDENLWASPDGSKPATPPQPDAPQPAAPQFGTPQFGTPQFGTPDFGTPQVGTPVPQPIGAWAPPPRPGLIPLAPMTLGTILGASFRVLRRNPRPVVGVSLVIHGIIAILTILITSYALTSLTRTLTGQLSGSIPTASDIGGVFLADLGQIAASALGLVGTTILLGIVTLEVTRGTVGERLPLAALWRRARGRLLVLVGWAFALVGVILLAIAIIVFVAILIASAIAAGGSGTGASIALGVLLGFLLLAGAAVIALWIGTKLSLVPSVLVTERLTLGKAMRRSWGLTKGYFWRTLGIELLVALILSVAGSVVTGPVGVILLLVTGLSHPTGIDQASLDSTAQLVTVISTSVGAIVATITAIVSTASTALIYLDLRIRKEGLDLQLMRFVDARQAGRTDVPDPYLVTLPPDATNA